MDRSEVTEIIACLPRERTIYTYARDQYAFGLLTRLARARQTIRDVRNSQFAALLEKPQVKNVLSACGDGRLSEDTIKEGAGSVSAHDYLLGLTVWGDPHDRLYSQTSRRGYNLVLQLNLNHGDMRKFATLVDYPADYNVESHPSSKVSDRRHRTTLAWARLDVSWHTDEVLVEELQSDFVRIVEWYRERHRDHAAVQAFCKPFRAVWQEAMLNAVVEFIWTELGVRHIYFHDHLTGAAMKRLSGELPPRSVYTELPRKFCMNARREAPQYLMQNRSARRALSKIKKPCFYRLSLDDFACC